MSSNEDEPQQELQRGMERLGIEMDAANQQREPLQQHEGSVEEEEDAEHIVGLMDEEVEEMDALEVDIIEENQVNLPMLPLDIHDIMKELNEPEALPPVAPAPVQEVGVQPQAGPSSAVVQPPKIRAAKPKRIQIPKRVYMDMPENLRTLRLALNDDTAYAEFIRDHNFPETWLENQYYGAEITNSKAFNTSIVLRKLKQYWEEIDNPQLAFKNGLQITTKPDYFEDIVTMLIEIYCKKGNSIDKIAQRALGNRQHFLKSLIKQYHIESRLKDTKKNLTAITLARIAQARPDLVMQIQKNIGHAINPCPVPQLTIPHFCVNNYGKICPSPQMLYIAYVVAIHVDEKLFKQKKTIRQRFDKIKTFVHHDYMSRQYTFEERMQAHCNALLLDGTGKFADSVTKTVLACIEYLKLNLRIGLDVNVPLLDPIITIPKKLFMLHYVENPIPENSQIMVVMPSVPQELTYIIYPYPASNDSIVIAVNTATVEEVTEVPHIILARVVNGNAWVKVQIEPFVLPITNIGFPKWDT